ncbi:MAG: hypothetical protein ABSB69_00170 [Solirubrobacteraceae bacterium]
MAVTQHSGDPRRRCRGWVVRGVLFLLPTAALAVSGATLPASALAATSPSVESLSASNVTQDNATVEARVNPQGLETTYELFMPEDPCNVPDECIRVHVVLAQGSIPATAPDESIGVNLASKDVSMEAGEQYGVAIIAKNSAGTVEEHFTFRTPSKDATSPSPPSIDSESVSNVTEHDATLEAQIDPNGLQTAYEFQIDTNGSYNYTKPACPLGACEAISVGEPLPAGLVEPHPESIPAGSDARTVSLDLASIGATLQPATTYHYRVITSNGSGPTVEGPDQTFTTPTQPTSPQGTAPPPSGGAGSLASELPGAFSATVATVVPTGISKPKAKASTNAQKLAKALKLCEKKPKKQRSSCKKQAEKKYATTKKKKS